MGEVESLLKKFDLHDRKELVVKVAILSALGKKAHHVSWLVDILGVDKTMELILVFGGSSIRLPSAEKFAASIDLAGAALKVADKKGTPAEVAAEHGVSLKALREVAETVSEVDTSIREARKKAAAIYRTPLSP